MATQTITINDSAYDWYTAYNLLAGYAGDVAGLVSGITDNIGDDTVTNALNYIYGLAIASDTTFTDPVTFQDTLTVQGIATLENNLIVNGTFNFDNTGSAAVSTILDEDDLISDSDTALATQQSIKAYVDAADAAIDAITLGGIAASSFLRSDSDDTVDNDIHIQFGDGTSGSAKLEHNSTNNDFQITPHNGTSFDVSNNFGFDGDNDYWLFAGPMQVAGLFTSQGIDDNATANKIQIENSTITLKTATTVQGALTISTGNVIVSETATTRITNDAGEFIEFDSVANETDIYGAGLIGLKTTATACTLYYAGAGKIATSNTGATVTGNLTTTGDVLVGNDITGPSDMVIDNGSTETVTFSSSNISLKVNNTTRIQATTSGASITGAITATGDGTFNTSDARLKNIIEPIPNALNTISNIDGVYYKWNKESMKLNPTNDLEKINAGLIAQNIKEFYPVAIGETAKGYETVGYTALIPLIIEAIKELNEKI